MWKKGNQFSRDKEKVKRQQKRLEREIYTKSFDIKKRSNRKQKHNKLAFSHEFNTHQHTEKSLRTLSNMNNSVLIRDLPKKAIPKV